LTSNGVTITISHRFDTPMTQPAVTSRHPCSGSWFALLALWGLAGCGHTEPFAHQDFGTDAPFDPTPPIRITLNTGHDRRAAWTPDGSAILYSTQLEGTRDHDICLAVLPPTGGRQRNLTCDLTGDSKNLTESFESAAAAQDGRLAFVAGTGAIGLAAPELQQLSLATLADPAARTPLLTIPYTIPGHRTHGGISQVQWLGPTRLLFLGEAVSIASLCLGCQRDTIRSGLDAVWLDVMAPGGTPQAVPGTDNASGVSPGVSEDELYYTLGGDTRVYRQVLSSGTVSVAYDFGAAGIARDVHVVGSRMAAIVGGRVHFTIDPSLGPTQWDSGGIVHLVSLTDGTDLTLDDPTQTGLFRRPRISPDGSQIVVERNPLVFTELRDPSGALIGIDTSVVRVADLYLMGQP
jgi:hypothetical protein